MPTYQATVLFNDGQEATSEHTTPAVIGAKLAEIIKDLTDENGIPTFQRITITPKK
ncbi:hypothetical protein OQ968_07815 [Mycobacterium sp. 663a-19]|uniref:hypothetical protein n=1 Tax=Mycobacterium sp. 663a-19 TaxID=2986148 RepID=UPI002D1EF435|nr:hypothetical protein [Mycobacterium sp. 663a-19]MEB3981163.1 hypothetical protein [Mycobacterium sp. 663a-19]